MRKSLFLTLVLSLCVADFGAFAAPARGNARGTAAAGSTASSTPASAPVAARAGARQKVVSNTSASAMAPAAGGNISARAGKKQTVKSAPTASAAAPTAGKPMAARAGATQKVIQTGSKVATAATNTSVPQECQDAFYGCMDSFCMLDNASGGRCQCNDRITELDKALEEILKLDQQTYIMATEGVERIQMGEAADQIMARAKAAADKVTVEEKKTQNAEITKKKIKQLDLSAWSTSIFDEEEEDVFGEQQEVATDIVDTFADKKGDELYKAAAKMCVTTVPQQCKQYGQMVQLVYAQRIKSDCIAYENSLKQQKNASQQKLLTAQKALRDAALDEFKDQNKYADLGSCEIAFKQCVQSTGECGSDFTGCVADNSILNGLYNKTGSSAAPATIKLTNSVSISKATYEILESKALMCESVVKQCVNVNKSKDVLSGEVFKQFVKDVAPALYSAEYNMASNKRMNCITTIMNCVKTSCKSEGMEQGSTNYEACLSNPDSIKNYCSLEINRCGDTMSQNDVLKYVAAKLAADKVDVCTEQIRSCLTSENACGEDYSGCIGLDTETIADLCPVDKLTACADKHDSNTARDYVNKIAMGLSLQIDNNMLTTCQNAVKQAMVTYCGSETECQNATIESHIFDGLMDVQICKDTTCAVDAYAFNKDDLVKGLVVPRLIGRTDLSQLSYADNFAKAEGENGNVFNVPADITISTESDANGYATSGLAQIAKSLNTSFNSKVSAIENDPKVEFCMTGRQVQTTGGESIGKKSDGTDKSMVRFPNLTQNIRQIVGQQLMDQLWDAYYTAENEVTENKWEGMQSKIDTRINEIVQLAQDQQNRINEIFCRIRSFKPDFYTGCSKHGRRGVTESVITSYDPATSICTITRKRYNCTNRVAGCCWNWEAESKGTVVSTSQQQMTKVNRETLVK